MYRNDVRTLSIELLDELKHLEVAKEKRKRASVLRLFVRSFLAGQLY